MSDLEQSDLENNSDDDVSVVSQEENEPTSSKKTKNTKDDLKDFDEEGNIIVDYDEDDSDVEEDDEEKVDIDIEKEDDDDDASVNDEENIVSTVSEKMISKSSSSKKSEELPTTTITLPTNIYKNDSDYESDDDEEEDDEYLQKFDNEMRENYILDHHPESMVHNYEEIYNLAKVVRNKDNIVIDPLHRTVPILSKYEKTRVLGIRAKQINNGAKPTTKFPEYIMDGYLIALKELEEKSIPVIIRRPLPNGSSEYWHLKDLEIL
jgi:DNA-directed RNA polymerases I, II, and III subunit RPABC2